MTADPCEILAASRRIAVLGMSPRPERTSHDIALYLRRAGFEIVPVNPGHDSILGLKCYASLAALDVDVDIVDVFRSEEHEREVADDILAMRKAPRAVWFQLNAGGFGVEAKLAARGIAVFVDRCIKVDHFPCARRRA
jgi:hypothetical protein